jgi:hypothetical protein
MELMMSPKLEYALSVVLHPGIVDVSAVDMLNRAIDYVLDHRQELPADVLTGAMIRFAEHCRLLGAEYRAAAQQADETAESWEAVVLERTLRDGWARSRRRRFRVVPTQLRLPLSTETDR